MLTDLEIARTARPQKIEQVAAGLGLTPEEVIPYGHTKAKVALEALDRRAGIPDGKLILVTAMSPTPAGEGKTTMSVGLADALRRLGKRAILALREPSLGPVFGIKGGAAGGGYAQVIPMEELNLHFTGDLLAISAANNLIAAMVDNHIYQGNELHIDPARVLFKRCLDMNDRQLRRIVSGQGKWGGVPREDGFQITAASELMAVFCLARDLEDLEARIGRIVVAESQEGQPVTAAQVGAAGAATVLLREAVCPNLAQSLEHTPALVHGGPFANIAHGCNSLIATRMALKLADYTVTEAGFGADLGAEKFLDIKCRVGGLTPSALVLVATVRALKMHGGVAKADLDRSDVPAVERGLPNLMRHLSNLKATGLPIVIAVNAFPTDTEEELQAVRAACARLGADVCISRAFAQGGAGSLELAEAVLRLCEQPAAKADFGLYPSDATVEQKLDCLARGVYGADGVDLAPKARERLAWMAEQGWDRLPVCVAKTQYSFSDDPKALGAPVGWRLQVRSLRPALGAGFIVALTGAVMTMPGLPKRPAALDIHLDGQGQIQGLF